MNNHSRPKHRQNVVHVYTAEDVAKNSAPETIHIYTASIFTESTAYEKATRRTLTASPSIAKNHQKL